MFDLTGQVALVTGAARGLGRAIAAALAGQGAAVLLNGRDGAALEAAVETIRADGGDAHALPADITDPAAREALFACSDRSVAEKRGEHGPDPVLGDGNLGPLRGLGNGVGGAGGRRFDLVPHPRSLERREGGDARGHG